MKIKINDNEYVVDNGLSAYDAAKAAGVALSRDIIACDVKQTGTGFLMFKEYQI